MIAAVASVRVTRGDQGDFGHPIASMPRATSVVAAAGVGHGFLVTADIGPSEAGAIDHDGISEDLTRIVRRAGVIGRASGTARFGRGAGG